MIFARLACWGRKYSLALSGIPEAGLIAGILWAGHAVSLGLDAGWATVVWPAVSWAVFRLSIDRLPWRGRRWRHGGATAVWLLLWAAYEWQVTGGFTGIRWVMAAYIFAGLAALRWWCSRVAAGAPGESWRLATVAAAGLWLMRPFLTPALCGAGDAQWYAVMTADMQQQVRAGIFPVFVGQSEYQFNGAIYPLRVSPAFHYLGALLDGATGRTLDPVALQNLLLVLLGVAAGILCYLCLAALAPARRWLAVLGSMLFLACPGVVGVPYESDLYMTWTAVPFVPIAVYGALRSFRRMDWGTLVCLGGGLGMLWWGHAPLAVWMTGFAVFSQVVRLGVRRPPVRELWREAAAIGIFLAVAAYPLISVMVVTPEPGKSVADLGACSADGIVMFFRQDFPAVFLPLSRLGRSLGDLQVGYSLWAVGLGAAVAAFRWRLAPLRVLAVWSAGLVLLVLPIPGLNLFLWRCVPAFVRAITNSWAMNRLYPMLGCLLVFMGWLAGDELLRRAPARRRWLYPLAVALCLWSGIEADKFAAGSRALQRPAASGRQFMMLENVGITRFAYMNFPAWPDYFTHGVTDPRLQARLLRRDNLQLLVGDLESLETGTAGGETVLARGEFRSDPGARPVYRYQPSLTLEPGRRYGVIFDFAHPEATGVLVSQGPILFRVYGLPEFGGPESFGAAPGHSRFLPLGTDGPVPEEIRFEFRPQDEWLKRDASDFAAFRFIRYDPVRLPVEVTSFIPYRARVTAPEASWLETPRMYQYTYQALVNDRRVEVAKSPQGLVMVPVPKGVSLVKVQYYPPPVLVVSFWTSFLAAATVGLAAVFAAGRAPPGDRELEPVG